jgi:hypothetical protein
MKKRLLWMLFLTLLFPITNLVIYTVRFQAPDGRLYLESLVFAPIGLIGGLIFFYFYDKAHRRVQKNSIIAGFLLAMPLAALGGLMGGLLGLVGTIVFGALPLAAGIVLGAWFGAMLAEEIS